MNAPTFTFSSPSADDCAAVAAGIAAENAKSPHMLPVSAEYLLRTVEAYGGVAAKTLSGDLAGFVKLDALGESVYEWGSLFVFEAYRGLRLARPLVAEILSRNVEKPLLCVTNVPRVASVATHSGQIEFLRHEIPAKALELIEWPQPLLPGDRIFGNAALKDFLSAR